jgi:hypothetical protein
MYTMGDVRAMVRTHGVRLATVKVEVMKVEVMRRVAGMPGHSLLAWHEVHPRIRE